MEIEIAKIAAAVVGQLVEGAVKSGGSAAAAQIKKLRLNLEIGFEEYIAANLERIGTVKTLVHPDEPIPIDAIYTPLTFRLNNRRVSDTDVIYALPRKKRVLIVGTAGGGKSMFIRHLCLTMLTSFDSILPIYFELRSLNEAEEPSLLDAIHRSVSHHIRDLSKDDFLRFIHGGRFALILDGFDEVNYDVRNNLARELTALCSMNPKAVVAVTTRPEEDLSSLNNFHVYHADAMSKKQTLSLLSKLDYDPERKTLFMSRVEKTLYDDHTEFLSNPLLATMMLMTYSHRSDIPNSMHVFYQQAFEVLFERHDRSKGVYTRKSRSNLRLDEFQRLFSHFCASSYAAEDFTFGHNRILEYVGSAIQYENCTCQPEDVLADLLESTCLMQRDGLNFSFVHRSFQEYFAAVFISRLSVDKYKMAVDAIVRRAQSDSTIILLSEINRDLFEANWALAACQELASAYGSGSPKEIFSFLFSNIAIHEIGAAFEYDVNDIRGAVRWALGRVYPDYFEFGDVLPPPVEDGSELNRIRAEISKNPTMKSELISEIGCNDADALLRGFTDNSPEMNVGRLSNEFLEVLDLGPWAACEYKAVRRLTSDIQARVARKRASIDDIFTRH